MTARLTSYHLRMLASAGLVEEDPDRGTRRDRWWRAAHDVSGFAPSDFEGTDAEPAASWFASYADQARAREVATWNAEAPDWSREWRDVADRSDYYLLATPDELRELIDAVHALVGDAIATTIARRDGGAPVPEGAEHVRLHLLAFPVREVAGVRLDAAVAPDAPDAAQAEARGDDAR